MNFKVHYKETFYFIVLVLINLMIIGYGFSLFFSDSLSMIYLYITLFLYCFYLIGSILYVGNLKGNGIKINEHQFPDIFEILESHSKKLHLKKLPDMYVIQGHGVLNAFALRFIRRNYVVLYSDVLAMAYQEGKDVVSFIIGHELGHIKRNHASFFKAIFLLPARFVPFLSEAYSRACEYTCDNIGYTLCPEGAVKGLLILSSGKKLYTQINVEKLLWNSRNDVGFSVLFTEIFSTHPMLIKRIAALNQHTHTKITLNINSFVSPKVDIQQKNI